MILVGVWSFVAAADLEDRERARLAGRPLRLGRRDLHRLVLRLDDAELAADQHREDRWPGPAPTSASLAVRRNEVGVASRRRCQADTASITRRAGDQRREQHVRIAPEEHRVGEQRPDVVELRPARSGVDRVADRVLHPRVRGDDEHRRQRRRRARPPRCVTRCTRLGSTSQPNSHSPRNVDSRKNAARPSIASGAPNTSPTNREYADQSIPNWNSCTSPVTTPTATLISSSVPKNRVSRR